MKSHLLAVLGLVALASTASVGCAAEADDPADDSADSSEDALTSRQLSGVIAVEVAEVRGRTTVLSAKTLGAPKKVKSLVTIVKKLRATDPQPRCLERDTTRLTYLDAAGAKLATVDTHCGGFGSISFESGRAGYAVKFDTAAVDAAKDAPFAVGDALWGISKIELSSPRGQDKKTVVGAGMAKILAGIDLDQVPDPNASMPRCLPTHVVTFKRGAADVAFTSFLCGATTAADAPASLKASFSAVTPGAPASADPLASGAISLDPRPIIRAASSSNE